MRQDIIRHNQLKVFFSNFSHDIKTSITRLRLQSEVLQEEKAYLNDGKLKQLLEDIARLDLQLENSLYVAQENDYAMFAEKMQLSELIQSIKSDFSEIDIYLEKDIELCVDKRLFVSVLRNLINNAVVHGQATEVRFKVNRTDHHCQLEVSDNGRGEGQNSKGFGIGLNLCRQLIEKMQGQFKVLSTRPFVVSLWIPVPR
jgi:signal transduction histidine kinase